jgi:hypothetical protein
MTEVDIQQQLTYAKETFLRTLQKVSDQQFDQKWFDDGRWGMREMLAHITGWQGKLASILERISRGDEGTPPAEIWGQPESFDDVFADHAQGKSKDDLVHEFEAAMDKLSEVAGRIPAESHAQHAISVLMVHVAGIDHLRQHTAQLRAWQERSPGGETRAA